jgi:hypothetical protein
VFSFSAIKTLPDVHQANRLLEPAPRELKGRKAPKKKFKAKDFLKRKK